MGGAACLCVEDRIRATAFKSERGTIYRSLLLGASAYIAQKSIEFFSRVCMEFSRRQLPKNGGRLSVLEKKRAELFSSSCL